MNPRWKLYVAMFAAVVLAYIAYAVYKFMRRHERFSEIGSTSDDTEYESKMWVLTAFSDILHRKPTDDELEKYAKLKSESAVVAAIKRDLVDVTDATATANTAASVATPTSATPTSAKPTSATSTTATSASATSTTATSASATSASATVSNDTAADNSKGATGPRPTVSQFTSSSVFIDGSEVGGGKTDLLNVTGTGAGTTNTTNVTNATNAKERENKKGTPAPYTPDRHTILHNIDTDTESESDVETDTDTDTCPPPKARKHAKPTAASKPVSNKRDRVNLDKDDVIQRLNTIMDQVKQFKRMITMM